MYRYFLVFIILLAGLPSCSRKRTHIIDESKPIQYLYVINSNSGTFENNILTLETFPLVVYFSDRPSRVAGHMQLEDLIADWENEKSDATLSIADGSKLTASRIRLISPKLKKGKLTFNVEILGSPLPKSFGPSSLFIDITGEEENQK